jgi:hypothetical protein
MWNHAVSDRLDRFGNVNLAIGDLVEVFPDVKEGEAAPSKSNQVDDY